MSGTPEYLEYHQRRNLEKLVVILPSKLKAGFRCLARGGHSWPAVVAVTLRHFLLVPYLFKAVYRQKIGYTCVGMSKEIMPWNWGLHLSSHRGVKWGMMLPPLRNARSYSVSIICFDAFLVE